MLCERETAKLLLGRQIMKHSHFTKILTPWTIILLLLLALIIFIPAVGEYFSGKQTLVQLWDQQGLLLSETILRSADKIFAFDRETTQNKKERMLDMGRYIREIDSLNYPDSRPLRQFARREGRFFALILNSRGQIVNLRKNIFIKTTAKKFRAYLRTAHLQGPVSLWPELPGQNTVVVQRSQGHGYILLMQRLQPSRRAEVNQRHLNGWMERLTRHPAIQYILLRQDSTILASSGLLPKSIVAELSVLPQGTIRQTSGGRVFEYSRSAPGGLQVVIGIPALALEKLQTSLIRRLLINSLILLLLGSLLVIYLIKKQNYSFLQNQYAHIQTYNKSVLENIDEGIIVLNQDRTISVFNLAAAKCLGISIETATGKKISELKTALSPKLTASFSTFESLNEIPEHIQSGGVKYDLLISANAAHIKEDEGNQQIYIILLRDNTLQRELEDFRNRRSKLTAMGELASRVAHEIRNPLNGIAVLAQRIQKEFKPVNDAGEFRRMAQSIRSESDRINEIIEAFLFYARSPELKIRETALETWIADAAPLFEALGPVIVEQPRRISVPVKIDPDQMKQVLINLVKNAVEASPEGEHVQVRFGQEGGQIYIWVEDRGTGIAEKEKEHVFDLYFSTKKRGSGLGLSIVEKIISAHGGKVRFESPYRKDGKSIAGTRFEITLPV